MTAVPEGEAGAESPLLRISARNDVDGALAALGAPNADRLDAARSAKIAEKYSGATVVFAGPTSFGGGLHTGGARGKRAPRMPSEPVEHTKTYLDDYTGAFVEPDWFDDACRQLLNRRLLVLSGASGTGRYAAALKLLSEVLRGSGPPRVRQLKPDVFGDVTWAVTDKAVGYVVLDERPAERRYRGGKPPVTAEAMDDVWMTRARQQLEDSHSFLVVITGTLRGRLASASRRHEFVLEGLTAPDPQLVFDARLEAASLKAPIEEVRRRLAGTDLAALLAERPRPGFAVRAANTVVAAVNHGDDLARVVRELRDPGEQVTEWFGDTVDPAEIAFAVATAVLEGCGYLTVSDAAAELHRRLAGKAAEPVTHMRRTMRTDHTWIELAVGDDPHAGEIVRFRNPDLRLAVLVHAWHELDGMRPAIQEWLRGMAGHSDVEVRARAATAAGSLAVGDLHHALHTYLRPWAESEVPEEQQSAAIALGVVGRRPEHNARVWGLLREFAAHTRHRPESPLSHTAALAAGGLMGLADPVSALRLLRELLAADDWSLLHPCAFSVARLVEDGASGHAVPALREWSDLAPRGDAAVRVLTAFVIAARPTPLGLVHTGSGRPPWPALLRDAGRHRDDVPELWARALANRSVRDLALDALRDWLRLADHDRTAYPVVLGVLAGIADLGEYEERDLLHQLEIWALDHRDPSAAAARAHDDLIDAEEATR